VEVAISVSPASVREGNNATFTVSAIHGSVNCPVTIYYSLSGNAGQNSDYTLTGVPGEVTIPAGQSSASVIFHANTDGIREGKETATMTLLNGPGYRLPPKAKFRKATATIPKNST
jgi:hypothetical protein